MGSAYIRVVIPSWLAMGNSRYCCQVVFQKLIGAGGVGRLFTKNERAAVGMLLQGPGKSTL